MTEIYVSNRTELDSALASASGGETITLADGYYGDLTLSKNFASTVTLTSQNGTGASFGEMVLGGSSNLHIDSLSAAGEVEARTAVSNLTFTDNVFTRGMIIMHGENIDIVGNDISGNMEALVLHHTSYFRVADNFLHDTRSDLFRATGDSHHGVIENNVLYDAIPVDGDHPDAMQFFGFDGYNPHDLVIRGNYIYDDPNTGDLYMQGIFLSDPQSHAYYNIVIEQNLINVGSPNGIFINGGQDNVLVQNNTLMPWPGGGAGIILHDKAGRDNSGTTVQNNISMAKWDKTKSSVVKDNLFFGYDLDVVPTLFSGDGSTWEGFVPVAGSAIDFGSKFGAQERLLELMNGNEDVAIQAMPTASDSDDSVSDSDDPVVAETSEEPDIEIAPPNTTGEAILIYGMAGALQFTDESDVINIAPSVEQRVPEGTISFSFNAEEIGGLQGIFAKDARVFDGGGNHFTAFLDGETMIIRFQEEARSAVFLLSDIEAGTTYDVVTHFGDGQVSAWVNGTMIGSTSLDTDFTKNVQYMQVGANGWASASGGSSFEHVFNGTISNVAFFDMRMTLDEWREAMLRNGFDLSDTDLSNPDDVDVTDAVIDVPVPDTPVVDVPDIETTQDDAEQRGVDAATIVYEKAGPIHINTASNVINLAHTPELGISQGTIAFSFEASEINGMQGLVSKDASYFVGGGHHFTSYLQADVLTIRFQSANETAVFEVDTMRADVAYSVVAQFGDGDVRVWLDGELIGAADLDVDFSINDQFMQIGANGWSSADGNGAFQDVFKGTISNVSIVDMELTPGQMTDLTGTAAYSQPEGQYLHYSIVNNFFTEGSEITVEPSAEDLFSVQDMDWSEVSLAFV